MVVKFVVGYMFDELKNLLIGFIYVSFELVFDYVIVKFLCWLFDKFKYVDCMFGMKMKVMGEVMVIERNMEVVI